MILSDTIKIKYKLNTIGMNSIEIASKLKDKGVRGFAMEINKHYVITLAMILLIMWANM